MKEKIVDPTKKFHKIESIESIERIESIESIESIERIESRAGKTIYRYQEFLDFASKSNNLTDRFLLFLHFDPVLLNFLSSFIYIS